MPELSILKDLYNDIDWFEGGLRGGYEDYDDQTKPTLPLVENLLESIGKDKTYKSILDIGCGYGSHLALAEKRGWECFGVEISDHARKVAIDRHGPQILVVESIDDLIPRAHDLILLLDIIEHLPDPYRLFYKLFAKGAIQQHTMVVITTPNARSIEAIADKEKWKYLHPPSHLFFYSAESLHQLLNRLHFTEIDIRGQYPLAYLPQFDPGTIEEDCTRNHSVLGYSGLVGTASGSDFTNFMRERYVPGTWSVLAEYEHLPRYRLAQFYCRGKRVLDFGCGTGYGTKMLAEVAKSAIGLDIDTKALEWAKTNHHADNMEFIQSETLGAELEACQFDAIICFEMIEHVDQAFQEKCLLQFKRLLKKGGLLIISTPNPAVTALYSENPFHLHEMTLDEFEIFLKNHFKHVAILKQFINPCIIINGSDTQNVQRFKVGEAKEAAYIGIVSNGQLPDIQGIEYFDGSFDFINEWLNQFNQLNKKRLESYTKDRSEKRIQQEIIERNEELGQLKGQLKQSNDMLNEQNRQLDTLKGQLKQSNDMLNEQNRQLDALKGQLKQSNDMLNQFQNSPVYPFFLTFHQGPFTLKKLLKLTYFFVAISSPEFPKKMLRHFIGQFRSWNAAPSGTPAVFDGKPHVLHVIGNFMLGGSSRLVCDIIEEMSEFHHEIISICVPDPPVYPGISARCLPYNFNPNTLTQFLSRYRPDLVHVHYWGSTDYEWYDAVIRMILPIGCRIVQNVNTPVEPYFNDQIDRYVYVSDFVRESFGRGKYADRSLTVHPGSNFQLFKRNDIKNTPDNCIGMVYRLEPDKLNEESILPFIEVVQRRPETRVVIVGGGTFLELYKNACREAGVRDAFTFTGYVAYERLPDYYRQLSLFVAPVWQESFGQVSPFAMSMGLPVVGYNTGALEEIIGNKGLLANNRDQLVNIIIELLDDRQRRIEIGTLNQQRAHELFSVEAMKRAYREIYSQLME